MKDNLVEMLLSLFEKSLSELHQDNRSSADDALASLYDEDILSVDEDVLFIKPARHTSIRVFTYEEQIKLSKASYQFLIKMKHLQIIDDFALELIMNQLLSSESYIITLEEAKWTLRTVLASQLDEHQLTFLDLVLYETEDALTVH